MTEPATTENGEKKRSTAQLDAIDIVTARLAQASAVVLSLKVAYTEQKLDGMQHILSANSTLDALDAVETLLDQAVEATGGLI
jgi:hypothetical protein